MKYSAIIGVEIHVQLNTKTKLFCNCLNEYTPDEPNKNICPFCSGQPGALPILNKLAVQKAIQFGVAVGAKIPAQTRWDRKNYFYPDLPSGYQISQYDNPIVEGGSLDFYVENKKTGEFLASKVNLTRAHLESDAGKSLHFENKTLVDFNRSGSPLIEIVTEPEIFSASQAMAFVSELQLLVRTLGISDANMEKGQMRFDCNISMQNEQQKKDNKLPDYKVEIKNINSVRSIGRAIEYEIIRQTKILENNKVPVQETRGWRDDLNQSTSQRSKEMAHDYRYFPEPDLQILLIKPEDIPTKESLPTLPKIQREKYAEIGLSIQIANTLVAQKNLGQYFDSILTKISNPDKKLTKTIGNVLTVNLLGLASQQEKPAENLISENSLLEICQYFNDQKINNQAVTKILEIITQNPEQKVKDIIESQGFLQISDDDSLEIFVENVMKNNQKIVTEYKTGKTKVIGFLVGQCMKESNGRGNPQKFKEILEKKLLV
jgi:aspartyl-tRNA(Asn)/glutamyl-tRNA(Gln) amidotransferase subunit B